MNTRRLDPHSKARQAKLHGCIAAAAGARRSRLGFTTMELVIVIALIGILAGVALPSAQILGTVRADMAQRRGLHALQYAQSVALSRNRNTWIRFNPTNELIEAFVEDPANPGVSGRLALMDPLAGGPLRIDLGALGGDIQSVDFGGSSEVEFDREGIPHVPGGAPVSSPGLVRLASGELEVIDGTGLVRVR